VKALKKIIFSKDFSVMNRSQLAYNIDDHRDKKWKETLRDICEVARLCLHNLVGSNTPPLPRCYQQEFEQAALHLGKEEVLDIVRVDSERQAYTMKTAILKASERIGEAKGILQDFDQEARKELGHMERHLEILNSHLKVMHDKSFKALVDSAVSFREQGEGFIEDLSQVIEEIGRQQGVLRKLVQKVHEDPLTGVLNRRAWERDLEQLSKDIQGNEGRFYTIVIADLDNFKAINDRYGHPVGDAVLRQFASVLHEHFSRFGAVYRYGGDEFTIIVKDAEAEFVKRELERLRKRLASAVFVALGGRVKIRLTASFGFAQGDSNRDVKEIISQADEMLYRAKDSGRDCVKGA